jgi:hypothetical protein
MEMLVILGVGVVVLSIPVLALLMLEPRVARIQADVRRSADCLDPPTE